LIDFLERSVPDAAKLAERTRKALTNSRLFLADTCQQWQWNRCGNQCGPRTGVLSSHRL